MPARVPANAVRDVTSYCTHFTQHKTAVRFTPQLTLNHSVYSETVNLLEENQKYLSQLTSLLQETAEEKSESIMVSSKS